MSGKRTGSATALPVLLLILPLVDAALISMLVRSIQENKPETGLFLIAYLQLVPQEIAVRALLQKRKIAAGATGRRGSAAGRGYCWLCCTWRSWRRAENGKC